MKLKATGLFVKDLGKMAAFYRDVVGFDLSWDGKDPSIIVEQDGVRFLMFGRGDFENMAGQEFTYPSGINGTFELGFDVDTEEDVDIQFNRMVALGAIPVMAPKTYPWGLRSSFIADPEGNLIEIATWKSNL